jgi:hypothetical protein
MPLSDEHETMKRTVSEILGNEGYRIIEPDRPFGPTGRKLYADLVAVGARNAYIIEVMSGIKTGSPDVMAMESFVRVAQSDPIFEGKNVKGIIVSLGTLDPARVLSREWDIKLVEGKTVDQIKNSLCMILGRRE